MNIHQIAELIEESAKKPSNELVTDLHDLLNQINVVYNILQINKSENLKAIKKLEDAALIIGKMMHKYS